MKDIIHEAVLFTTYYEDKAVGKLSNNGPLVIRDKTPHFTGFYFDSVYCNGAQTAISITGLPELPVDNIHFKNMIISADKGLKTADAKDIYYENIRLILPNQSPVILSSVKKSYLNSVD
jgi:hypothetical protein